MYLSTLFNIVLASTTAMVSGSTTLTTTNNEGGGLRRNLSGLGYSICLDEYACEAQAERDGVVHFHKGEYPDYGCFSKNGKYFWGHGGTSEQQSDHELAGIKERVYCAEYSARGYDDDDDDHHDDDDDWHGVGDDHYYYDTSEWRSASHHSWSKSSKSTSWSSSGKSGKSGSGSGKSGKSGWWSSYDDNWSGDGWYSKSSKSTYHSAKSSKSTHHSTSTKWSKPSSHSKSKHTWKSHSKSRTSQSRSGGGSGKKSKKW